MPDPAGTVYQLGLHASNVNTGAKYVNLLYFFALDGLHDGVDLIDHFNTYMAGGAGNNFWQQCNHGTTLLDQIVVKTWLIETAIIPAEIVHAFSARPRGLQNLAEFWQNYLVPCMLAQHCIVRTASAGRSARGRLYFPPGSTNYADTIGDQWRWAPASVAKMQQFLDQMFNQYGGASDAFTFWRWCMWSRKFGGNLHSGKYVNMPPFHSAGYAPIVSGTAYAGIRVQKRREAPRGV